MKKILISLLAIFLTGCSSNLIQKQDSLKIGVIAPLSGPASGFGEEVSAILNFAQTNLGENAENIELIFEDGKCNGSDAVTAFNKLVDIDSVDVIIGGVCSPESIAIAPLADQNQILALSATSGSSQLEGLSEYLYSFVYGNELTVNGISQEIKDFEKVALITELSDINVDIQKGLIKTDGDKIVLSKEFSSEEKDFRNLISTVLKEDIQAIILNPKAGTGANNLLKQLSEFKDELKGIQLISHVPYLSDDSRKESLEISEGMIIVATPNVLDSDVEFIKTGSQMEFKALNNFMVGTTFDAFTNVVEAAKKADFDKYKIKDAFLELNLQGVIVGGKDFNGQNMMNDYSAGIYVVKDGKAQGV